ncbi:hypothetical protein N7509_003779 [Penicillium cosmopolitanum]|uniref:CENP-V/GFA domain-containing protein n=1 Tax=Penicillium cosmopolitanum TaxID=1131564 RepID=A0A9W9W5M9_9EURO|nr:uncharacterized protein N7509_003779 [Penicillium cosmopolitanum]KAJ5403908.1 hypothetical protein N7509_003779 [Penicillium cosmopolitanum]
MAMTGEKTLAASCHCRNVQYTVSIPVEILPLEVHMCHCSVCRYTYGAPCCFHADLPPGIEPEFTAPSSLEKMTAYALPRSKTKTYFCSTCGCCIGGCNDTWTISTSIFDANRDDEGIWLYNSHMLPDSAPDGGLAAVFSEIDGLPLQIDDLGGRALPDVSLPKELQSNQSELRAECHCGGVSFTIARPSEEFIASSESKGWLSDVDKSKWLACMDVCDDCRLVTGTNVIAWMFVARDHITPRLPKDLCIGTAKSYRSTEGVNRVFCGDCGATVFYHCDERPNIVDVSMGILRAPEGAMAENWSVWRAGRPSWPENGLRYHAGFSHALIEGMKRWGAERGHPQEFQIP